MRGKIIVIVLLVGAAIFTAFAFWFFNNQSSPDNRFNLNRQPIPANARDSVLFGPIGEDYQAQISQHITPDTGDQAMGSATYDNGTDKVELFARALTASETKDFQNGSSQFQTSECNPSTSSVVFHSGPPTPFRYTKCHSNNSNNSNSTIYEFEWLNGNWYLRASESDVEALLHFVNLYPY